MWEVMGDKQLREHCKKYFLAKTGRKPELVARLKEYALRYNSQLDNPVPAQKTGKEVMILYSVQLIVRAMFVIQWKYIIP